MRIQLLLLYVLIVCLLKGQYVTLHLNFAYPFLLFPVQYTWGRDCRIFSSIKRATRLVTDDYLDAIKWFCLQWTSHAPLVSYMHSISNIKVRMKANIRNRYNQIPHLTQDTIWERHKNTRNITFKTSALSQQVITRLLGTDKTI